MRYRKLSPTGDYVFGHGSADYYINVPQAPAQAVETRLELLLGEWYLNLADGTPYATQVLGYGTSRLRDVAIKSRVLGTPGVKSILQYSSVLIGRKFTADMQIDTIYGQAPASATL